MNNMHNVWAKRFEHYIGEVMKYMRFVFTGHIAIVLVFIAGAGGYQYSEWLKVVPTDFPAEWIIAIMIGALLAFSRPVTLIKEPDQVYLLPLESQMPGYFKKAMNWTFWSQVLVPVVLCIIAIPLLKAVTELSAAEIWMNVLFIAILKWFNVRGEFYYRYVNRGQSIGLDRVVRIVISILAIQMMLTNGLIGIVFLIMLGFYNFTLQKRMQNNPVPYEHFIRLEQNRMMSFYRFANYFTDVPHLKGSVKRRAWLDIAYKAISFKKENTQAFLIYRTFIRTDDHFYLWVRLTAISAIIAMFITLPFVTWIVVGALAFATTLQLKYALMSAGDFRMDMLYPIPKDTRKQAVAKLLRQLSIVQAIIVTLCAVMQPQFYIIPVVIIGVSELTIRMSK
ncbi:ABC transporter permease [Solibacillus merdavium]|uniref:ABC transporter permease n=1 Tax=Solibacillus merdavium TaxID=2762218 RepID=A0ABR8XPU3_9BACL|nr:ABC transporter permease [Solibacillus merdavium]MBD8033909.1 ABC transporter permease [Solibacillus merdavium]